MTKITYSQAINKALTEEMNRNKKLVCGDSRASKEEVDAWVKATKGQLDKGTK